VADDPDELHRLLREDPAELERRLARLAKNATGPQKEFWELLRRAAKKERENGPD
jgi:hypothetical protein